MKVLSRESYAEEEVLFVHADGRRTYGSIRIGMPRWIEYDVEARCQVTLVGLGPTHELSGASTLQALLLALRYCVAQLDLFLKGGGRILYPEGEEEWEAAAVFGRLLGEP